MYLFLSCLVACCLTGVDLWDPTILLYNFDADQRAADTAKLINLVNNARSFKVFYISRSNDSDGTEDEDGKNVLSSMKLVHKTFDKYRKSNDFIDGANIQYISNPKVIQDYENLPKERSEIQDLIDGEVTTKSSSIEEPDRGNIKPSHPLKNLMKHFRRRQEMNLDTSNFDDNDAGEQIAAVPVPRDSKETKRFILKSYSSMSHANQVKPIADTMLNKYTVKVSLQKSGKPSTNNNLKKNKKLLPEESRKEKSYSKKEHQSINYSKENHSSDDKKDVIIDVKKRFKIASDEKNKNTLKTNKQESRIKEIRLKEPVRKEQNDRVSNDRNSKLGTRQKTHKVDDTETKDENKKKIGRNKGENKVPVNEQATYWENDEKNQRQPESHDAKFEREINQKKKDNIWSKPYKGKNVNTGENYDSDEKSKLSKKQKSNNMNKQNDMDKKDEDEGTTSSNRNKKVDSWNKRDDTERLKGWDKKDDNWNKKDDSRSEERTRNKKDYDSNNKREDDDDLKSFVELKKYSSSDSIRTDKTENSGWGNYALFKKLRDKKNSMEGSNIEKEKTIPKVQKRAPKPSYYEGYAPQRDDYYHQPKKSLRSFNRTPIPMSGKRPIFD